MASLKAGVVAGCNGCSSPSPPPHPPPPPYSVRVEKEARRRVRVSPPLYSKEIVVGGVMQDERGRQDAKTKQFVVPSDDQKPLLGRNLPLSKNDGNDVARSRWREGTPSVVRALFGTGDRRVSKLRLVEEELEALRQSSTARISALEGQLRAADTAAVAASYAANTAAAAASYAADTAAAAATFADAIAAHEIEFLEYKLLTQAELFETKLEAAESGATKSIRIARLEERISVASLRAELSSMRNPVIPGQRRNFSS